MTLELKEAQTGVLKSKIIELQSALFFTESSSLVKLPTHVITDVEMDEEEQIWFVIPRPRFHIDAFDKELPATLEFSKKGTPVFVKVRGTAYLITDIAEVKENKGLSQEMKERMMDERVMAVKVKVQDHSLVDNTPKPAQNWLQFGRTQLSSWFF
ncbi:hypothetical protein ACX0G9_15135 [Flavitalea flava]